MSIRNFFEANWRIELRDLPNVLFQSFTNPWDDPEGSCYNVAILLYGNRISHPAALLLLYEVWENQQRRGELLDGFEHFYFHLEDLPNNSRCEHRYYHLRKRKWLTLWYKYE